ncbi:myelin and lymphocyte protein [Tupaia chinensis]|uniref:myelin and lymphocyte protein n=1 Tax=Tupaia chinensis TaxID=246437 RepID=UPI0003C8F338|nr:myelin and lymphocyte protein [Tupaia chinensis]
MAWPLLAPVSCSRAAQPRLSELEESRGPSLSLRPIFRREEPTDLKEGVRVDVVGLSVLPPANDFLSCMFAPPTPPPPSPRHSSGFRLLFVSKGARSVFGGLVWILIASSLVPIPMIQGWVMFVSVFCFVATTTLIVLYMIGAHGGETSWVTLDAGYHCIAALFYLSASVLEALATILMRDGYIYKQYHENISAVVFAYVATLLYVVHAVFSLIRWKSS